MSSVFEKMLCRSRPNIYNAKAQKGEAAGF
jgi:hypothetical protein